MADFEGELEERLIRYAAINSQSDGSSDSSPSTAIQHDLLKLLERELTAVGAEDVCLTDYGVVLATITATTKGPTIGFLAHVDTSPQYNASGVKPRVVRNYKGGEITFPDAPGLTLSPDNCPHLAEKKGHDIVTASGTTLLGADDKAGISIIMTAARHLLEHPDMPRGEIRIAFNPDEEIGRGVDSRLPDDLGVDFAYTFDGGSVGEIGYETFSADQAVIRITGVSIHPGLAEGKLVNATHLASKLVQALTQKAMTPETTSGREGFIHVTDVNGGSSEMEIKLIIRDYELDGLEEKGECVRKACEALRESEPRAVIDCAINPQYRNMRYWLDKDMAPVDLAFDAARSLGLDPVAFPLRGGTDGSLLTEMGVPTPNLFTGQQNIHGPLEWVSVQDMAKATQLLLAIVGKAVER